MLKAKISKEEFEALDLVLQREYNTDPANSGGYVLDSDEARDLVRALRTERRTRESLAKSLGSLIKLPRKSNGDLEDGWEAIVHDASDMLHELQELAESSDSPLGFDVDKLRDALEGVGTGEDGKKGGRLGDTERRELTERIRDLERTERTLSREKGTLETKLATTTGDLETTKQRYVKRVQTADLQRELDKLKWPTPLQRKLAENYLKAEITLEVDDDGDVPVTFVKTKDGKTMPIDEYVTDWSKSDEVGRELVASSHGATGGTPRRQQQTKRDDGDGKPAKPNPGAKINEFFQNSEAGSSGAAR